MMISAIIFSYILVITSSIPTNGEEKITFEEIGIYLFNTFKNLSLDSSEERDIIYDLGFFRVNLTQIQAERLLLSEIKLSVKNQNVINELNKREPQIKDLTIDILRQAEITDEGQLNTDYLKNEIKSDINQTLGEHSVESVWFSELIMR